MVSSTVLLLLALPVAAAADSPKPNALTPKEIADGWCLLFDGETTFGWTIDGPTNVAEGALVLGDGAKPGKISTDFVFPSDFDLIVEVAENARNAGQLRVRKANERVPLAMGLYPNKTFKFEYRTTGKKVKLAYETTDGAVKGHMLGDVLKDSRVALTFQSGATAMHLRSIRFRPVDPTPLFSGKDLAGWKVFDGDPKRNASKWAVTKAGELHVSNGPGDLQTEKQYADFLLQFDCKTNGSGLNSGVFFRCRANEYQQGYEAQIQNAIVNDDRTKPLDFGTGAIYRRVKARKVVSNDNEWFTMTVMAIGPNIRTWVNGYPVVNWTDDRPPADNGRNGQYLKPGHLSIQGHDPTTDILFRNIQIVETKK